MVTPVDIVSLLSHSQLCHIRHMYTNTENGEMKAREEGRDEGRDEGGKEREGGREEEGVESYICMCTCIHTCVVQ